MRSTKREKRLIEELIPLARYVESRYSESRHIEVRWLNGSQPYDAVLFSSGFQVEKGLVQKEMMVEITVSIHQNDYLIREALNEQGYAFGVKRTSLDKKTGVISSIRYVSTSGELENDLAEQIISRIREKAAKDYSPNTVLIVDCVPNGVTEQEEWENVVARVTQANAHQAFSEVFLIYNWASYSATLYGNP